MSKTVVNVEETLGKTAAPEDAMPVEHSTAERVAAWHQNLPTLMPRRGTVQRFRTFEEADAAMTPQQSQDTSPLDQQT